MCRPSPVFIQIAQKIAVWNGTWASNDGTFATSYETRGKAGRSALFRNAKLLILYYLTPAGRSATAIDSSPTYSQQLRGITATGLRLCLGRA